MTLTHENASGTGSTDGATVEKTSMMGRESPNLPSIGTIDATGKAYKACRGTGKIGLDDDENGGSSDGREIVVWLNTRIIQLVGLTMRNWTSMMERKMWKKREPMRRNQDMDWAEHSLT